MGWYQELLWHETVQATYRTIDKLEPHWIHFTKVYEYAKVCSSQILKSTVGDFQTWTTVSGYLTLP